MECEGSEHLLLATKLAIPPTYRKKIVPLPRSSSHLEAGDLPPLQSPPLETCNLGAVVTELRNNLMTLHQSIILALDDYQTITEPAIHQSLQFLLEHLPTQLHLFITTRTNFPLPIARLRVQGKLTELRAADLRFTPDETEYFLTQAMGLPLSTADIATINEHTEGW